MVILMGWELHAALGTKVATPGAVHCAGSRLWHWTMEMHTVGKWTGVVSVKCTRKQVDNDA